MMVFWLHDAHGIIVGTGAAGWQKYQEQQGVKYQFLHSLEGQKYHFLLA